MDIRTGVFSINRNILECKDMSQADQYRKEMVLIETYWNVKWYINLFGFMSITCINRNILECKVIFNKKSRY